MKLHWDLFCSVIDNYGDVGICWRIARELTAEHGQQVRLWVDDLDSFQRLWPNISPDLETQICEGVEVRRWAQSMPEIRPADVVVEAFACRVPESFLLAMAERTPRPVWLNLEYFSAEDWVAGCHGLGSLHPRLALTQYFFIPGLGIGTGGVPGGRKELAALDAFQNDDNAVRDFWADRQVPDDEALRISLFAYENPAISGLMETLAQSNQKLVLLVPEGRVLAQVAASLRLDALAVGDKYRQGNLEVWVLPFMQQNQYDRMLWASDINFVRGEDSFVRAQHAGKPMVWQAYVQEDGAHWHKLDAFLEHYMAGLSAEATTALRAAWQVWNAGEHRPEVWQNWFAHLDEYRKHARKWSEELKTRPNLVEELVKFVAGKL
jgi:uncharacterized repeat protein (TIGR03837 family)